MDASISEDELRLLAYLHEHATGYDKRHELNADQVAEGLGVNDEAIKKHASYLVQHGLIGVRRVTMWVGPPPYFIKGIWITTQGENFMRALESRPSVGKRVTAGVVKEMGGVIRSVATEILTEFVRRHI